MFGLMRKFSDYQPYAGEISSQKNLNFKGCNAPCEWDG